MICQNLYKEELLLIIDVFTIHCQLDTCRLCTIYFYICALLQVQYIKDLH